MNGRERIQAAFSPEGTPEIPAVICYEGIFVRDHWSQLGDDPWWMQGVPDVERQSAWRRRVAEAIGQDWFELPLGTTRTARKQVSIEERGDGVYAVDARTGSARRIDPPQVGGWSGRGVASVHPAHPPQTPEEVERWIGPPNSSEGLLADGQADLSRQILATWGASLYPMGYVAAPLWRCYSVWGFEGMMVLIAEQPELIRCAVERFTERALAHVRLAGQLGALGVWIEDCMTDMIGAEHFRSLNLPYLRRITDEVRAHGMRGIYYYCGDPVDKWRFLLDTGADALSLEESKKGFAIDVEEVVDRVQGRIVVLGNLDAVHLLETGTEAELAAEIARQIAAGQRNGGRFIMSLGSPVTPGTPASRVRRYCDLAHELGSR